MEIAKEQLDKIERILGKPLSSLSADKPRRTSNLDDLPSGIRHQIEDVLEADMKMPPEEATKVVREYLRSRKNAK